MTFNPVCLYGTSEFTVEVRDGGDVIAVVWLFGRAVIFVSDNGHTVYRHLAVCQPAKSASVFHSPVSCQGSNQKKRGCEAAKFASC